MLGTFTWFNVHCDYSEGPRCVFLHPLNTNINSHYLLKSQEIIPNCNPNDFTIPYFFKFSIQIVNPRIVNRLWFHFHPIDCTMARKKTIFGRTNHCTTRSTNITGSVGIVEYRKNIVSFF